MSTADVQGLASSLWLNGFKVTRKLSYIKVAKVGEKTNFVWCGEESMKLKRGHPVNISGFW
jgi:hypothetical protein